MSTLGISAMGLAGFYLCANVLIVAAAALLAGIRALNGALPRSLNYRQLLIIGRILAVTTLLLPVLAPWQRGSVLSPIRAQIWAASSMRDGTVSTANNARIEVGVDSVHALVPVNATAGIVLLILTIGILMTLLPLLREVRATIRTIRGAQVMRSLGSVRIFVSDQEPVPFATWFPGRSVIVLPAALLLNPVDFHLALRHEGQHHRQGDTRFLYAMLLCRALLGINPAVHWISRQLVELQEFACDEALTSRAGHCTRAYCACLLRVAETALGARQAQLRSSMASWHNSGLRTRIEAVLRDPARPMRAPVAACFSVIAVALLTTLSAVIAIPVHDRRLSRADAEQLVATTPGSSVWGLVANGAVLEQLNLLVGTPDGRAFLRSSLERMRRYEPGIREELKRYDLPQELLTVPLVESGYQNLPARRGVGVGAGLWMFIGATARQYGLEVSARQDERLQVSAETRAALHMFSDLRRRFRDWPLALMAYNSGVSRVEAGINAVRTRDAWTLYHAGYGNDPDYLARTAAVMLIFAHPRLLD